MPHRPAACRESILPFERFSVPALAPSTDRDTDTDAKLAGSVRPPYRPRERPSGRLALHGVLAWLAVTLTGLILLGPPAHGQTRITPRAPAIPPFALATSRARAGSLRVTWLTPMPVRVVAHRDTSLLLQVTTAAGRPLEAPVFVRMAMTAMPMGDVEQRARRVGAGRYRVTTDLTMPGNWYALVTVGKGSGAQVRALPFAVVQGPGVPWRLVLPLSSGAVAVALGLFWFMTRSPKRDSGPPLS